MGLIPPGSKVNAGHLLAAFDSLHWIWTAYTTFHMLWYRKEILNVSQKGINEFPMLCVGFKVVEIIKLYYVVPYWLNTMGLNLIDLCSNLVPVWSCNIQHGPLLQHLSFMISFVCTSHPMDQMLVYCIAVFQYVSIICQCEAAANAFETCRVA